MENLFIIGSPRSGTTFLASLLKPTRFGEPFETQFIIKYATKLDDYGDLNQLDNLQRIIDDICGERAIAQWQVAVSAENMLQQHCGEVSYVDVVNYICCRLMAKRDKSYWGDKTPHYILALPKLVNLFPKAKYLYIVRDGRDVALSLLQKPWGPNNVYSCAEHWHRANNGKQLQLIKQLQNNDQLMYIKYEELIDDPRQVCTKIYQFLDDDINNYTELVNQLINKTKSGNSSKWKLNMTSLQIATYDAVAKTTLMAHDYPYLENNKQPSWLSRFVWKAHNLIVWAKHMFVQNVIDGLKIKFFGKQPFDQ